jgi:hypothetical protein
VIQGIFKCGDWCAYASLRPTYFSRRINLFIVIDQQLFLTTGTKAMSRERRNTNATLTGIMPNGSLGRDAVKNNTGRRMSILPEAAKPPNGRGKSMTQEESSSRHTSGKHRPEFSSKTDLQPSADTVFKMCKKIAQLTKVIFFLNARVDNHEVEKESITNAYEQEIYEVT